MRDKIDYNFLHVVRLFVRKNSTHQVFAVDVLDRTPIIPGVFPEMEVGEYGQFECPGGAERQTWFGRVGVELLS